MGQCENVIYLNKITNDLPFIVVPYLGKFLIDTGSSKSLMNPIIACQFYNNFIRNERFNIQTAHARTFHDKFADIPIFDLFNVNGFHTFYLFDFSPRYDGLIGTDLLTVLGVNINFKTQTIESPTALIPLHFNNPKTENNFQNFSIKISQRTQQIVKIPVNFREGIGILEYRNFGQGLEMPKALVNIENYFGYT